MGSAPVAEREPNTGERPLRVLIVDDHAVVQWGFKVLLGRQRWVERCVVASDPEEGLAAAARLKPHVALVDLFLGERSGAELCEAIRAASPKTRVLLISGVGWISPQAARAAGASGFVSKDWSADEVAMAVRMVGKGMTVFGRQEEAPATPLSQREREVLALIASGADQPRDRRAPVPLAAHGQGARQLPLSQARRQEPRRGRAAGRAPRADPLRPGERSPRGDPPLLRRCTPRSGGWRASALNPGP